MTPSASLTVEAILARLPERGLEAFTPWDNIPWEAQAGQLLRCPLGGSFIGLRPGHRVDHEVAALIDQLALRPGAAVLDLGCGPGLHGNRLGARGYSITGIDIAGAVLDHAQAEADAAGWPCRYLRMSFLDMTFARRFDAAFLANSTFNHLADAELGELLRRTREALTPGGMFACEVHVAPERSASAAPREHRRLFQLPYSPWSDRPHHWVERLLSFPAQRQRVTHHVIVGDDGELREHWSRSRLHDPRALTALFAAHGLAVRGWYDHDLRAPLGPESDCAWVVAQRSEGST